jgi:hypothetical protein
MPLLASPLVQLGQRHAVSSSEASVACGSRDRCWAGAATRDGERRGQIFRLAGSVSIQADDIGTSNGTSRASGGARLSTLYVMTPRRGGDPLSGLLYADEMPVWGNPPHRLPGTAP